MKWESLLDIVADEPVFSTGLLLSGKVSADQVRLQLSRWVRSGRLVQLRRGIYALGPAWRRTEPHPFLVANKLQHGSYVSMQSAMAYHGLIPEYVPVITSAGPGRPGTLRNPLGTFQFRHLASGMLFGYAYTEVAPRQYAFIASAEKALLDLVYLTPGADSRDYLGELRLQAGAIDLPQLRLLARRSCRPKLVRAALALEKLMAQGQGEPQ